MEESSQSPLKSHFQSKKNPLLTTPIKKSSTVMPPVVVTPEQSDPNPNSRNRALSISNVRRKALQFAQPDTVGSDSMQVVTDKLSGLGVSEKSTTNVSEKHQILCDFFVAMVTSIRLLRLKGVPTTLTKLANNIESLTDRTFTVHHLSQLKYIVPELIVAKKIRVQDGKTKCMHEDLLLSIEMNAVKNDKNSEGGDGFSQLKKIFRSRLIDFSNTHLEDDDIPEGELPHVFHQPEKKPDPNKTSTPLVASLIAPTFKRRFSSKPLGGQVSEPTPVNQSTSSVVEAKEAPLCPASIPSKLASIPQETKIIIFFIVFLRMTGKFP